MYISLLNYCEGGFQTFTQLCLKSLGGCEVGDRKCNYGQFRAVISFGERRDELYGAVTSYSLKTNGEEDASCFYRHVSMCSGLTRTFSVTNREAGLRKGQRELCSSSKALGSVCYHLLVALLGMKTWISIWSHKTRQSIGNYSFSNRPLTLNFCRISIIQALWYLWLSKWD